MKPSANSKINHTDCISAQGPQSDTSGVVLPFAPRPSHAVQGLSVAHLTEHGLFTPESLQGYEFVVDGSAKALLEEIVRECEHRRALEVREYEHAHEMEKRQLELQAHGQKAVIREHFYSKLFAFLVIGSIVALAAYLKNVSGLGTATACMLVTGVGMGAYHYVRNKFLTC